MANSFSIAVTPEQFSALGQEVSKIGLSPTAASGILPPQDGVRLSYIVRDDIATPLGTVITFTVDKKPFYVSMDAIEAHVKALIGG